MLAAERRQAILAAVARADGVRVTELAAALAVSEMTIRRDIEVLDAAGALTKVHGGATRSPALSAVEPRFAHKAAHALAAKQAIAAAAAALVRPGMSVGLTGGTTTFQLAPLLARIPDLTVLTNSLPAAEAMSGLVRQGFFRGGRILLTGGEKTPSEALVGPLADAAVASMHTDICFMGAHGIDAGQGINTPNLTEAATNRAFLDGAEAVYVLADGGKFNIRSLAGICPLTRLTGIITSELAAEDTAYAALTTIFQTTPRSSDAKDQP